MEILSDLFYFMLFFVHLQVSVDGDEINFKTSTMLKTMELKFKLAVEFDEKSPDGREVKAIVTQEGDKFISSEFLSSIDFWFHFIF